ncbi:MAG: cytochrome c oxidase assembly protein, partial [Actinomycetota bacterium]|nr:cytochrome c oxidase assembly protein [Actinomycetota bacterium]
MTPAVLAHLVWWGPSAASLAGAALAGTAYGVALLGMVRRRHRLGIARRRAGSFYVGLVVFGVALSPALDSLASQLFAAHMVQHLLLILVVGSLVTAGRPGKVLLGALPPGARR